MPILASELQQILFEGRLNFYRSLSSESPLSTAGSQESSERLLYASGMDFFSTNGVIEKQGGFALDDKQIDEAIYFFSAKNLSFTWWTDHTALENRGFHFGGYVKGMVLEIGNFASSNKTLPLTIKKVATEQELQEFTHLCTKNFSANPQSFTQNLTVHHSTMEKGSQTHFLGFMEDKAVATATFCDAKNCAAVCNLSTLPEYQRQGVGRSLMAQVVQEGLQGPYSHLIALVKPQAQGVDFFKELNFIEVWDFPFYVYGP